MRRKEMRDVHLYWERKSTCYRDSERIRRIYVVCNIVTQD